MAKNLSPLGKRVALRRARTALETCIVVLADHAQYDDEDDVQGPSREAVALDLSRDALSLLVQWLKD